MSHLSFPGPEITLSLCVSKYITTCFFWFRFVILPGTRTVRCEVIVRSAAVDAVILLASALNAQIGYQDATDADSRKKLLLRDFAVVRNTSVVPVGRRRQ
jgi:hypothetical protein